MSLFTSSREKRLWLYTFMVLVAIISTLVIGSPLVRIVDNQEVIATLAMFVMFLIGATIIVHGLKTRPSKTEIVIWLGLSAVYLLLFLRLGHPERTHLMEYGVLAIFIHKALIERARQGKKIPKPGSLAFLIAFAIGVLDEFVQIFLPSRVFDTIDILFNGLAAFMSIGASMVILWVRKKISKD